MNYKCLTCKYFTFKLTPEQIEYALREGIRVAGYCVLKKQLFVPQQRSKKRCKHRVQKARKALRGGLVEVSHV